ncbi:MAG: alpha-E domain-containing protein, partial [Bacteroidota bacterium]
MLSRVASSLYWLGRYVERSEHLARFLRVQYFSILDTPMSQNKEFVLRSILGMYGIENEEEALDEKQILLQVGLDIKESASVISAVSMARENAR